MKDAIQVCLLVLIFSGTFLIAVNDDIRTFTFKMVGISPQSEPLKISEEYTLPETVDNDLSGPTITASSSGDTVEKEPVSISNVSLPKQDKNTSITSQTEGGIIMGEPIGPALKESEVAIGYEWSSPEGSPKFSVVQMPLWGLNQDMNAMNVLYTIEIWNGYEFVFFKESTIMNEIIFPEGGVSKFRVTGINPDYLICPGERGVFPWGIKFASDGIFTGERRTLTKDLSSEGKTCRLTSSISPSFQY